MKSSDDSLKTGMLTTFTRQAHHDGNGEEGIGLLSQSTAAKNPCTSPSHIGRTDVPVHLI